MVQSYKLWSMDKIVHLSIHLGYSASIVQQLYEQKGAGN